MCGYFEIKFLKKDFLLMLKRLSLDKGKKKKKEVANVSLLNRKYSYFVANIYATFKRNSFTKLSFSFVST